MSHRSRRNNGFTLVELMVAIGLFGLLMGIAVPSMWGYLRANRLDTETDVLRSDLAYARALAIARGRVMRFSADDQGYTVVDPLSGQVHRQHEFPDGVTVTGEAAADFFPWGAADTEAVGLTNGSDARTLNILPTGIVEVGE